MSEERGNDPTPTPETVGGRLRAAREAAGLTLPEVASRTRVPQRHLEAIEASDYAGLPSATYAVGFVRAYARAVGADEVALARDVRADAARTMRTTPVYEPYETADPTRVPSRTIVIIAAGLALAVILLGALWFGVSQYDRDDATAATPAVIAAPVPAASSSAPPALARDGQVTLTAEGEVWIRVYDAANTTLFMGTLTNGQSYDVPRDASGPLINVGRPDKLTVKLNGSVLPPLGTGERAIKDVPVGAAALADRRTGTSATAAPPAPAGGSFGKGGWRDDT